MKVLMEDVPFKRPCFHVNNLNFLGLKDDHADCIKEGNKNKQHETKSNDPPSFEQNHNTNRSFLLN